ncbi:MAG: hypothetical protein FWE36_08880 [Erysipelotrichales bacterium]|nr:hypothetical protein [Erysipelotrichales bacterium]
MCIFVLNQNKKEIVSVYRVNYYYHPDCEKYYIDSDIGILAIYVSETQARGEFDALVRTLKLTPSRLYEFSECQSKKRLNDE